MKSKTVSINGTVYDAASGKAVRLERAGHGSAKHASEIHSRTQHSQTLNRRYVASHAAPKTAPEISRHVSPTGKRITVTTPANSAPRITKFAKQTPSAPKPTASSPDIAPTAHPLTEKVHAKQLSAKKAPVQHTPASVLKQQAIAEASARMTPRSGKKPVKAHASAQHRHRLSLASLGVAFMLFSGYMTYLYMPNVTTRVAAAQAGVNAHYPAYSPSGYRLSGPVAYQPGEVSMKFAANTAAVSYTLTQKRSGWDSSATVDNYVTPKAGDSYTASRINGLTIYSFDDTVVWVNDGVLYTISGDAPLSTEQVQHIATSL